ncbi:hypothetical protein EVAR_46788_1 [Eumeta japonica]|uniref:Uncharacterized protein n=1 Tax=Eumeta variegata TaxID=151549 RepID=A0A4C1XG00_EUMVA|nr:hypothetical protein EVAR_46788_1 [Eumeta japonica]
MYSENAEKSKTEEETKKIVKATADPTQMQIQIDRIRKIGNAGIIFLTTSMDSANRIRECLKIKKASLKMKLTATNVKRYVHVHIYYNTHFFLPFMAKQIGGL